jgi:hypothetical protein
MTRFVPLAAALLLAACHQAKAPFVVKTTALHVLVGSNGKVEMIKRDWTNFSPVSFGELISPGDVLLVAQGATASIVCSDLSARTLQVGPPGPVPCPSAGELTAIEPYLPMRSGANEPCPAVISPRGGRLLDPRPPVRWIAVPASRDYTVAFKAGAMRWQRDIHLAPDAEEGRLSYPGDASPVPAGVPVSITISGGGLSSDKCAPRESELRLLTDAEQASIRAAADRISALGLSPLQAGYLRANLFLSHDLYAQAIDLLESLPRSPDAAAALDRLLGDAYSALELEDLARRAYRRALDRIASLPDVAVEAALNDALAKLTADESQHARFRNRAIELYRQLGNSKRVAELTRP